MKKNKTRFYAMMLAVLCCFMAFSVSAYASDGISYQSNENGVTPTPGPIDEISITTETVPDPSGDGGEPGITWDVNAEEIDDFLSGFLSMIGGTPLTPTGNMTLVDDILQDESYVVQDKKVLKDKQFITVETKNGNYFYIIIDRSGETENVYFLNMVDESDLLALMDDGKQETAPVCTCKDHCEPGAVNTNCPVCKNNMSECMGKEAEKPSTDKDKEEKPADKETEKPAETSEKKSSSGSLLIIVLILALAGGGALYWFKFRKKQPDNKGGADLDDYDFGDDEDEYEIEDETADDENDESKGD